MDWYEIVVNLALPLVIGVLAFFAKKYGWTWFKEARLQKIAEEVVLYVEEVMSGKPDVTGLDKRVAAENEYVTRTAKLKTGEPPVAVQARIKTAVATTKGLGKTKELGK